MASGKSWEDADFMPEIHGASRRGAHRFAHLLLVVIIIFFVSFYLWARQATLDEVTRGDGTVIASGKVQVVQNLEGGIVAAILVHENDTVSKNQVLLRIDNVAAASDYRETRARYLQLSATVARLEAEIAGKNSVAFTQEVLDEVPEVAKREDALFQSRKASLDAEIDILRRQEDQRKQELVELEGRMNKLETSLQLAVQEMQMTEPMVQKGVAPQIDLLRLKRQVNDIKGDAEATRLSIPRARSALAEASRRIGERVQRAKSDNLKDLNDNRATLSVLAANITAQKDKVTRTEVRSPVKGTIKQILVNTIGGVIRPGQDLVEIVPIEETLLVEARIRPSDVGFLRPGLDAMVKVTAYDYGIYGGLKGKLEEISADAITDEKGEKFYRIRLRTDKNYLGTEEHPLPIISGMTTSVDILTGSKTVLDYLLKPILKARQRALRER
ncbi:MAG: HlyD family type I secretion periplasmic adaptor subunit [Alphaproteobacteria bacterium]